VLKLGYCAGKVLSRADVAPPHRDRPAVLIGKDTRISGYMLESALESGLSAAAWITLAHGPDAHSRRGVPHARAALFGRA
jgi:phosphoglucosamine mutase